MSQSRAYRQIKQLNRGDRVQITLKGSAANVKLMDYSNLQNYKNGRKHSYYGGLITRSPAVIPVPRDGDWYLTVDLAGLVGTVTSSAKVLPNLLPVYQEPSLSSVPSLYRGSLNSDISEDSHKEYDVFISHASEDKDVSFGLLRMLCNILI